MRPTDRSSSTDATTAGASIRSSFRMRSSRSPESSRRGAATGPASVFRSRRRSPSRTVEPHTSATTAPRAPTSGSRFESELLQHRVDSRKAALRALLYAVLHRRVPMLGRLEAHRLRELRPLAEILELERLEMILERLPQPLRRLDLAELALDEAVARAEAPTAARPDVHL